MLLKRTYPVLDVVDIFTNKSSWCCRLFDSVVSDCDKNVRLRNREKQMIIDNINFKSYTGCNSYVMASLSL